MMKNNNDDDDDRNEYSILLEHFRCYSNFVRIRHIFFPESLLSPKLSSFGESRKKCISG